MQLEPIAKRSLSDHVFQQIVGQIVAGDLVAGASLPSERRLCELLGVNRGAIREAVKRLGEAGLVRSRHGSPHQVLDYRRSAGLDFLARLVGDGSETATLRSLLELRAAIAPDAARLCAERDPGAGADLTLLAASLAAASDRALQLEMSTRFWDRIIEGSDNVAYRLAYNSIVAAWRRAELSVAALLEQELVDVEGYHAIAENVGHGSGFGASCEATAVLERATQEFGAA